MSTPAHSLVQKCTVSMLIAGNLFACAANIHARMPGPTTPNAGQVAIRFNHPIQHVLATVNGFIVADDDHTQQIVIDNVPPGPTDVQVAMGGYGLDRVDHSSKVFVPSNGAVSVVVAAPDISVAHAIISAGLLVFEGISILALVMIAHDNREFYSGQRQHGGR
jgi:hypothetical protein